MLCRPDCLVTLHRAGAAAGGLGHFNSSTHDSIWVQVKCNPTLEFLHFLFFFPEFKTFWFLPRNY